MKDKDFNDFIDAVENGEIQGRGLLVASLDYRSALKIAFEAGYFEGWKDGKDD